MVWQYHGATGSAGVKVAGEYIRRFVELVAKEGYFPKAVFSSDETGLFGKKMPMRT